MEFGDLEVQIVRSLAELKFGVGPARDPEDGCPTFGDGRRVSRGWCGDGQREDITGCVGRRVEVDPRFVGTQMRLAERLVGEGPT